MDTQLLSAMLRELMLDHDSIGLPGMGTFVAEEVPASFSDKGYTINPPYRRLLFVQGSGVDETLSDYYARVNGIDRAAARAIIADYVVQLREVLVSSKNVTLRGLGRLRATRENNFFFIQDENLDIFPDGMTLQPVSLKTHTESDEEVSMAVSRLSQILAAGSVEAPAPAPEVPAPEAPEEPAPVPEPAGYGSSLRNRTIRPSLEVEDDKKSSFAWWLIPLIAVCAVVVFLCIFLILANVAPDFIDSLLYSEEELELLGLS